MKNSQLEYYHIAETQVETAIDLFKEGNFISSITLAAAGEEILGKLLPDPERRSINILVGDLLKTFPEFSEKEIINHLNLVRNGFKHVVEDICEQDIDLKPQALQYILRACKNYEFLRGAMTQKMIYFCTSKE